MSSMVTLSPGLGTTPSAYHSRISGIGGYRPERVVPNSEIVERIDSSDEWIRQRSGIEARHRAAPEETVVDMAEQAARAAIAHAGLEVARGHELAQRHAQILARRLLERGRLRHVQRLRLRA